MHPITHIHKELGISFYIWVELSFFFLCEEEENAPVDNLFFEKSNEKDLRSVSTDKVLIFRFIRNIICVFLGRAFASNNSGTTQFNRANQRISLE